jgi:hypothetical protein
MEAEEEKRRKTDAIFSGIFLCFSVWGTFPLRFAAFWS